jgi:hypothetical protein
VAIGTTSVASGSKTDIRGHLALSNSGTASELRLYEPSGSGSNYTALKTAAQSANVTYTLPTADGTDGHSLMTNGAGTLSWGIPVGASTILRKTADESINNSTTLQDDNTLSFSAAANDIYLVEIVLFLGSSGGGSGDIKVAVNSPTGSTKKMMVNMVTNAAHHWDRYTITSNSSVTNADDIVTTNPPNLTITGMVVMGSTAGNIKLQWAQNTSHSDYTTVETNSYMKVTRIQ